MLLLKATFYNLTQINVFHKFTDFFNFEKTTHACVSCLHNDIHVCHNNIGTFLNCKNTCNQDIVDRIARVCNRFKQSITHIATPH